MKNAVEWNTHFNSPSGQNRKKKQSKEVRFCTQNTVSCC